MPSKFHRQVAALPFRQDEDGVHLLMVTSRTRKRWILPKGNPIKGLAPNKVAEVEALEEAGVVGSACDKAIGAYAYDHLNDDGSIRPSKVAVYPLLVTGQKDDWKEKDQRTIKWIPLKRAAKRADDEELSVLLEELAQSDAKALRRIANNLKKAG
ncbi:MAG: NUDIX hydrolase [Alphaproteobacteria bacterium]|nr:NUDIX hydrolase [Alphaproteobacteria bacterium]